MTVTLFDASLPATPAARPECRVPRPRAKVALAGSSGVGPRRSVLESQRPGRLKRSRLKRRSLLFASAQFTGTPGRMP
jgi:hypothetical protein